VGQMMGAWFLATSLGNLIAGLFAGEVTGQAVGQMSSHYLQLVWMPVGAGIVLLLLARPISRMSSADSVSAGGEPPAIVAGPSAG